MVLDPALAALAPFRGTADPDRPLFLAPHGVGRLVRRTATAWVVSLGGRPLEVPAQWVDTGRLRRLVTTAEAEAVLARVADTPVTWLRDEERVDACVRALTLGAPSLYVGVLLELAAVASPSIVERMVLRQARGLLVQEVGQVLGIGEDELLARLPS